MERDDKPFHTLVDDIYEAALRPEKWPETLTNLASLVGCPIATIVPFHNPSGVLVSPGMESGAQSYADYWWQKDIFTQFGLGLKTRGLVCDWDFLSPDVLKRDPFYQEFRRDLGLGHCCAFVGETYPGATFSFGAHFDVGRPPSPDVLETFQSIAKHVNRALAVMERSCVVSADLQVDALLDLVGCAAAIVDESGQVVRANRDLLLCEADGLRVVGGKFVCARTKDQASLDMMMRKSARHHRTATEPEIVLITRPSGRRPFLVRTMPLPSSRVGFHVGSDHARRHALVLIVDLESEHVKRPDAALQRLGLTPAEARVAALVGSGYSTKDAAVMQGTSEGTTLNQLKSVFSKLRVSRQTDLALLIARLSILGK